MVGTPGEVDIFEELVKDRDFIPKGKYDATVTSVEFDVTKSRMMPYARIRLGYDKYSLVSFLYIHTLDQLMFLKHLLPRMVGETVKVKVDYKQYNETTYRDCRIILNVESNSPQDEG